MASAYFEVRLDDNDDGGGGGNDDDEKIDEKPTGGMSFSVGLDHGDAVDVNDKEEKNLQLAARLHRIKSEMRRSSQKKTVSPPPPPEPEPEPEKPLEMDDLVDSDEVPSETGTYTLRLDSAEVRERKNLVNITQESILDQNSATESADQEPIIQEPEFEIPTAVSARITEWFNRNEAAESRASDVSTATDSNLDDIREKAKTRIKERNVEKQFSSDTMDESTSNITTSSIQVTTESSKIVLSREDRTKKKKEPQVRLTRAMLLRKNRALGIKGDESPKQEKKQVEEKPKPKRISSRLDNLSKPKRVSEVGLANNNRQRSFSHEDAKVYRGRQVAKPVESAKGPTQKKDPSRSSSLTRKSSSMTVGSRQDLLSRSVRSEKIVTKKQQRSTSLTRSSTTQSLKVKSSVKSSSSNSAATTAGAATPRKSNTAKSQSTQRITSSSSSSRPNTAGSSSLVRDSHETSILYSLNIISANCLQKTKSILAGIVDDMSEVNDELDAMTQEDCVDLEGLFGRICALDKCLGRVRTAQDEQKAKLESPTKEKTTKPNDDHEESEINL